MGSREKGAEEMTRLQRRDNGDIVYIYAFQVTGLHTTVLIRANNMWSWRNLEDYIPEQHAKVVEE